MQSQGPVQRYKLPFVMSEPKTKSFQNVEGEGKHPTEQVLNGSKGNYFVQCLIDMTALLLLHKYLPQKKSKGPFLEPSPLPLEPKPSAHKYLLVQWVIIKGSTTHMAFYTPNITCVFGFYIRRQFYLAIVKVSFATVNASVFFTPKSSLFVKLLIQCFQEILPSSLCHYTLQGILILHLRLNSMQHHLQMHSVL